MKNKKRLSWFLGVLAFFMMGVFSFSIVSAAGWDLTTLGGYNLPGRTSTVKDTIITLANWLIGMFGFFGIIGFMISGIMYLVSTGNDEMITKAKKFMTYSAVGIIVGLSGYVFIQVIDNLFNAKPF